MVITVFSGYRDLIGIWTVEEEKLNNGTENVGGVVIRIFSSEKMKIVVDDEVVEDCSDYETIREEVLAILRKIITPLTSILLLSQLKK